jgi:hypothetical protein
MQFSAGGKREPFAFIGILQERRNNPKNKRKNKSWKYRNSLYSVHIQDTEINLPQVY